MESVPEGGMRKGRGPGPRPLFTAHSPLRRNSVNGVRAAVLSVTYTGGLGGGKGEIT